MWRKVISKTAYISFSQIQKPSILTPLNPIWKLFLLFRYCVLKIQNIAAVHSIIVDWVTSSSKVGFLLKILSWLFKLNSILRRNLGVQGEPTPKLSLQSLILELVGGRIVTQVIIHHNMCPIFLFPPLGVIGKFSLPDRLSREPQAAGFSQRAGVPVLWWEGRQRRHG